MQNFKRMIKSDNYQMMIDHLSHTITQVRSEMLANDGSI